ncbi:MAG: hypothetical protein IT463_13970 [Planctomycetes bacterium]|nr:hypothetical protein [Planctomycetota bacterium]
MSAGHGHGSCPTARPGATGHEARIGELHGKTVVVGTAERTYVGRCSRFEDGRLILVDLDELPGLPTDPASVEYLERALEYGHWPRVKKLFIPQEQITLMELLVRTPWRR